MKPYWRPTDSPPPSPVVPTCKTSIALTATILKANTNMAACGRHHKRGDAAFGRATSFVVSFVLALNKVNIVAVTTTLVLHVGNGRSSPFGSVLERLVYNNRAKRQVGVSNERLELEL